MYNYLKALHLIFVITWFAGLFYIVRLFVYQIEAAQKPEPEREIIANQLKIMAKRLWVIIAWPSMMLAVSFGILLLVHTPDWLQQGWMQMKLAFVVALIAYHLKCHQYYRQLQRGTVRHTSGYMRLFNEGATLILFAVVFLVVLKSAVNWVYGILGLLLLALMLMLGIRVYKRLREPKN